MPDENFTRKLCESFLTIAITPGDFIAIVTGIFFSCGRSHSKILPEFCEPLKGSILS